MVVHLMGTTKIVPGLLSGLALFGCALLAAQQKGAPGDSPMFYRDVLAVLEEHCQVCHRAGGIAPMAFQTYEETRAYAGPIADAVRSRRMPPWFAEKGFGHFSNDPSLTAQQIVLLASWAEAGAPADGPAEAPPAKKWTERWTIPAPDAEIKMAEPVHIPARGDVHYTYEIVPTHFPE